MYVERLISAGAIATLVGVFFYQVAYGMEETVTSGNITATLRAPNGTNVTGITITPVTKALIEEEKDTDHTAKLLLGTWNFVNETHTDSVSGKMVFYGISLNKTVDGKTWQGTFMPYGHTYYMMIIHNKII